jgi:hypothetical protein
MTLNHDFIPSSNTSREERERTDQLHQIAIESLPHFGFDWNASSSVFLRRQSLSRILFLDSLYQKIVGVPGAIVEFGTQFGASLSIYLGLRGIYEPYNFTREIYGFDTFNGFPEVLAKDGERVNQGDLTVPEDWQISLQKILELHKQDSPLPNLVCAETIKGDVQDTWIPFTSSRPHLTIAMAYFDLDLYSPTKYLLENILEFIPKGGIVVFDQFSTRLFPGETTAIQETLKVSKLSLQRSPLAPTAAWIEIA